MNLLGKAFVVTILVLSALFLGLSMAVYSAHKNWPAAVAAKQKSLNELQQSYDAKKAEYERLKTQATAEFEAAQQQIRKLESERVTLVGRNNDIQTRLSQLEAETSKNIAALEATQTNNSRLASENSGLRDEIRTNQEAADKAFDRVVQATEELHDTKLQLDGTLERNQQLVEQTALYLGVINEGGLDPNTAPKPRVDGFVSKVQRRPGEILVEVTIGADDGLKAGHTIELFRDTKYLGRAEILRTAPDRAVGRIEKNMQKGTIQEGDRVATRLKLS